MAMRRRYRASSKTAKAQSPKAKTLKAARHSTSSASGQETEVARLTRKLHEAQEQQTATAEVLKIISASPAELQPVLEVVARSAARFCEADDVTIFELDGEELRTAAHRGTVPQEIGVRFPCTRGSVNGRSVIDRKPVHVIDLQAEVEEFPEGSAFARRFGHRTIASVPLLREGLTVGTIVLRRTEVNPFTNKQITLLETFAAQAVIAIENARLLNELRQRTSDLSESLEQQTATSDVLKVISSSPGDLQPVFSAILESAARLCDASFGNFYRCDDDALRLVATYNTPVAFAEARSRSPLRLNQNNPIADMMAAKTVLHVDDLARDERYTHQRDQTIVAGVELAGVRTFVAVPMLKDNEPIGALVVYRQEVHPFTDKQIELVKNFAAQAVIAIENARLLNELRQRTADLTEALGQQTATADVLRVISSSPGELQPVFTAMLANATRLCDAPFGNLFLCEGENLRLVASHHPTSAHAEWWSAGTLIALRDEPTIPVARMVRSKNIVHVTDMRTDRAYIERVPRTVVFVESAGIRTLIAVPMLKEDELIGGILIYRQEVRAFTDKQIALVQNFAAQAVIAIENARLLNELRQSLEQQTATAEVLRVISSSPTNVQPVFDSIAESAVRLCGGQFSFVVRFDGKVMEFASHFGLSAEGLDAFRSMMPMPAGEDTASGRAILRRTVVEVPDIEVDDAYGLRAQVLARAATYRSIVAVPLLHEKNPIGAITVARANAGFFPERQIALLQAFADQAVIAIHNVGLFDEVQARTEELSESLQQQTATADVLKVISRSTFDLKTVLDTLLRSAARLCEADQGTITQRKGDRFYRAVAFGYPQEFMDYVRDIPVELKRDTGTGRALLESKVIQIPDIEADPEYTWREARQLGGFRAMLGVPMLREGEPIGVLTLTRKEPRPFTEKQIELVTTFADQAAIAIENVRLFDEIQDKSRQLEVASQHKSQFLANMSHELRTPLNAILGYTELMADGAYGEPSEKMLGILKRLEANGKHLLGLINDVLDLSKS
jgi:GAF domain-containing protein